MREKKTPEVLLRTYTADMRTAGLDIGMAASVLTACLLGKYHGLARGLFGTEVADAAFAEAVAEAESIMLPAGVTLRLVGND